MYNAFFYFHHFRYWCFACFLKSTYIAQCIHSWCSVKSPIAVRSWVMGDVVGFEIGINQNGYRTTNSIEHTLFVVMVKGGGVSCISLHSRKSSQRYRLRSEDNQETTIQLFSVVVWMYTDGEWRNGEESVRWLWIANHSWGFLQIVGSRFPDIISIICTSKGCCRIDVKPILFRGHSLKSQHIICIWQWWNRDKKEGCGSLCSRSQHLLLFFVQKVNRAGKPFL